MLSGTVGLLFAFVVSPQLIERFGFETTMGILAAFAFAAVYGMLFGLWRRGTLTEPRRWKPRRYLSSSP